MWVSIEKEQPLLGQEVPVRGQFVPPNTGYPIARLCNCTWKGMGNFNFESKEWRGMVGITHWWKEPKPKRRKR